MTMTQGRRSLLSTVNACISYVMYSWNHRSRSACLVRPVNSYAGRGGKLTTTIGYRILEDRVRRHGDTEIAEKLSFIVGDETDQLEMTDDELYDEVMVYLQT